MNFQFCSDSSKVSERFGAFCCFFCCCWYECWSAKQSKCIVQIQPKKIQTRTDYVYERISLILFRLFVASVCVSIYCVLLRYNFNRFFLLFNLVLSTSCAKLCYRSIYCSIPRFLSSALFSDSWVRPLNVYSQKSCGLHSNVYGIVCVAWKIERRRRWRRQRQQIKREKKKKRIHTATATATIATKCLPKANSHYWALD